MEKITTHRSSAHTADVEEPIIIEEKESTRRVFLAYLNDTKTDIGETVAGTIVHQRKKKNDEWENIKSINLATLKGGEGIKIRFNSKQLRRLYLGLEKLYKLSMEGLAPGETEYAVANLDKFIKVPKNRKEFILNLLSKDYCQEIWDELIESNPDLATRLSIARLQTERQKALNEFSEGIRANRPEDYWQTFFEKNQWIFGYGLRYHFMTQLRSQPSYGGTDFTGSGNQKGDFLLNTEANVKFTVLVELKKPDSRLLSVTQSGKPKRYRNGAWLLGSELLGGISQLQTNCKTWLTNSSTLQNVDHLRPEEIHTISPKGILIIGNTRELNGDREKIETFESLRRSLNNPEIITFDELYERARFIVEHEEVYANPTEDSGGDDVPF